jgi:hypothetical protein
VRRSPPHIGNPRKPGRHWPGFFVCVLVCLPWAATAQLRSTDDYLARMDADGDGRVSLREYQDWLSYAFDAMDRNHDAVLSGDEQPGGHGMPLSRAEHRARLAATFARQDRDHDGLLDARELAAPPR